MRGKLLDVGCGPDATKITDFPGLTEVVPFDEAQGDANLIDSYYAANTFDVVYGSQVLEHLHNPHDALRRFLAITKPGGHVVMSIPDFVIYENSIFPSRFNPDHKTTWGFYRPNHDRGVGVADLVQGFVGVAQPILIQYCDTNYDYALDKSVDQTFDESRGVEAWIEFVVRKN